MIHSRIHRLTLLSLALGAASLIVPACDTSGSVTTNGDGGAGGDQADADPNHPGNGPDGGTDPGCPAVNVNLAPVVPTVLLLLDQSGSMTTTFGTGTNPPDRYEAMTSALVDATNGVVAKLDSSVIFGASLYTSHNGNAGGTCPILKSVTPALNNLADIKTLLENNAPDGDTPTGESIVAATGILTALGDNPDAPPSPKIIVLATDGEPDTCAVPNPQHGQADAVAAAQAAFAAGFPLFILSVGNEVGATHQQDMANAGAGKPLDHSQGDAPFYTADNPAQLQARFDEIIGGVRPPDCTFAISSPVDPARAGEGTVKLNGTALVYDDPNGWTLVDASTLKLNGTACQQFLADPEVQLFAQFPCGVVVE